MDNFRVKHKKTHIKREAEATRIKGFAKELGAGAFAFLALLVFCACSERIVYKNVLIPTKCDVKERTKPKYGNDFLDNLNATLIYSEGLKKDLDYCRGVKP